MKPPVGATLAAGLPDTTETTMTKPVPTSRRGFWPHPEDEFFLDHTDVTKKGGFYFKGEVPSNIEEEGCPYLWASRFWATL